MVIDNLGMQMCCLECDVYVMCLFVNYNCKFFVCELNNVKENKFGFLIMDEDFVYNEMVDQVNFGSILFLVKLFLIEICVNGIIFNMKIKFNFKG